MKLEHNKAKTANVAIVNRKVKTMAATLTGAIPKGMNLKYALELLVPDQKTRFTLICNADTACAKQHGRRQQLISERSIVRAFDEGFPEDVIDVLEKQLGEPLKRVKAANIRSFAASLTHFEQIPMNLRTVN